MTKQRKPYKIYEGYIEMSLNNGMWAKISKEDFENVKKFLWNVYYDKKRKGYCVKRTVTYSDKYHKQKFKTIYLSRFIMTSPSNMVVDHINHDTLDNRRENLRVITHGQNLQNLKGPNINSKTKMLGVCFHKASKKWCSQITLNNKKIYLGTYDDIEDANFVAKESRKILMPYSLVKD